MQSLVTEFVDSVLAMPREFGTVVAGGPVEALLVLIGALLVAVSMGVFGYLTLGALVDLVTPDLSARTPPRAGR